MGFTADDFMTKAKFYAVRKGRKTGLFTDWETCKAQVYNFPAAEYKGFKTKEEAEAYLTVPKKESSVAKDFNEDEIAIAYVDGSFNLDEWKYGSGVYFCYKGKKIGVMNYGDDEEYVDMRNVAGEIKAAMIAVQMAEAAGAKSLIIVHDYTGIAEWVTGGWDATKYATMSYRAFMKDHQKNLTMTFRKVAGHSGDKGNEIADALARKASGIDENLSPKIEQKLDAVQFVYL